MTVMKIRGSLAFKLKTFNIEHSKVKLRFLKNEVCLLSAVTSTSCSTYLAGGIHESMNECREHPNVR